MAKENKEVIKENKEMAKEKDEVTQKAILSLFKKANMKPSEIADTMDINIEEVNKILKKEKLI